MECSRGIAMGILSVRLSNACIVTKRKKAMFRFLHHTKEHLSGPSLPVPVELVSGDVFIVAPEYVDAPEC